MPMPMNNPVISGMVNQLKSNPNFTHNPLAQNLLAAIESGDAKKGEEIAKNLCQSYGITPEDACKQAMSFFTHR